MNLKRRANNVLMTLAFMLMTIVYVLSCGPAFYLVSRGKISGEAYGLIYLPIMELARWEPAGKVLLWYTNTCLYLCHVWFNG